MKKDDLSSNLHILNILLCLNMYITFLVFFIIAYSAPNSIPPNCFILLCIITKIFLLYVLFNTFEKFYPYSTESKIV